MRKQGLQLRFWPITLWLLIRHFGRSARAIFEHRSISCFECTNWSNTYVCKQSSVQVEITVVSVSCVTQSASCFGTAHWTSMMVYLSKQLVKVNVHVSSNVHQLVRLWQTDPAVQSTVASSITMKPV